jgi:sulfite exporter TauE/SafE
MCGGIAAAIERPTASQAPLKTKSALLYDQLIMHFGRISTYVLLGAIAAWIGVVVWQQNVLPIQRVLFVLTFYPAICHGSALTERGWV